MTAPLDLIAIDADGHVHEENILFTEYFDPAFRDRTAGWALNADNNRQFIVDGAEHPPFPKEISVRKPMTAANRVKVLNKERIIRISIRAVVRLTNSWKSRRSMNPNSVACYGKIRWNFTVYP